MSWLRPAILILAALVAPCANAARETREACKVRVQAQIDRINARMRQGYTGTQGEHFRRQLRDLKDRYEQCKKIR